MLDMNVVMGNPFGTAVFTNPVALDGYLIQFDLIASCGAGPD